MRLGAASAPSRHHRVLARLLELLLLPRLDPRVVMVAGEDPPEDAQPWLAAPAVGVAVARQKPDCLSGAVVQGETDVAEDQDSQELLHVLDGRTAQSKRQGF